MPVSPKDVFPFVHACDKIDDAIAMMDEILASGDEKLHRRGEWLERNDYFYTFKFPNWSFNQSQKDALRDAYEDAGWPVVQIFSDAIGTTVRLFVNPNSKFFEAP